MLYYLYLREISSLRSTSTDDVTALRCYVQVSRARREGGFPGEDTPPKP